jgi:hypothetical protein
MTILPQKTVAVEHDLNHNCLPRRKNLKKQGAVIHGQ